MLDNRSNFYKYQDNFVTSESAAELVENTRIDIACVEVVNGFAVYELKRSDNKLCGAFAVSRSKLDGCSVLTFFYDLDSAREFADKLSHLN